MSRLETISVTKGFAGNTIIENINIHLEEGEIVSLLGVSGSGKTTLFNVISGLYHPDSGKILLDDEDITSNTGKVSYMLQKDLLLPYYTVLDNVCLPLVIKYGMKKKQAREKATAYFEQFGLEGTQKMYPSQLSGGMRQRAAFLRTYLSSEGVALLDEPFSALDTITKSKIHEWYLDIMKELKLSTLFVTHDIDEAILLSDRVYIMSGNPGTITAEINISDHRMKDKNFSMTPEFIEYKKKIIEALGNI